MDQITKHYEECRQKYQVWLALQEGILVKTEQIAPRPLHPAIESRALADLLELRKQAFVEITLVSILCSLQAQRLPDDDQAQVRRLVAEMDDWGATVHAVECPDSADVDGEG